MADLHTNFFGKLTLHSLKVRNDSNRGRSTKKTIVFTEFVGKAKVFDVVEDVWANGANERGVKEVNPILKIVSPVIKETLEFLFNRKISKVKWSRTALCACGCSPGFIIDWDDNDHPGTKNVWMKFDLRFPFTMAGRKLMLNSWKEVEETSGPKD